MKRKETLLLVSCVCTLFVLGLLCAPQTNNYSSLLASSDVNQKRTAIIEVGKIGPKAQVYSKDLVLLAVKDNDPEIRRLAIESIGNIRPHLDADVIDACIICINDEDVHLRRTAISAVFNFENFPPNLIGVLQKRLGDEDRLVRQLTISTFEKIGQLGVRPLVRALSDPNADMRLNAVITLGRLGGTAKNAINDLKNVEMNDENDEVKRAATQALEYINK